MAQGARAGLVERGAHLVAPKEVVPVGAEEAELEAPHLAAEVLDRGLVAHGELVDREPPTAGLGVLLDPERHAAPHARQHPVHPGQLHGAPTSSVPARGEISMPGSLDLTVTRGVVPDTSTES